MENITYVIGIAVVGNRKFIIPLGVKNDYFALGAEDALVRLKEVWVEGAFEDLMENGAILNRADRRKVRFLGPEIFQTKQEADAYMAKAQATIV